MESNIYKERRESPELLIYKSLMNRMKLTDKEKQYGEYLVKGYEGEKQLDYFTEALTSNCMILNDLFLEVDRRVFQLDTTIITAEQIFILK
ncbi:NERD domain-containing protein [Bacillus sp. B1-b2]|nr:NERD domain-containing protein [Bacillus sp. B1-b2]